MIPKRKIFVFGLVLFGIFLTFFLGTVQAAPTAPTNVTTEPISACAVRVSWNESDSAAWFNLVRQRTGPQKISKLKTPPAPGTLLSGQKNPPDKFEYVDAYDWNNLAEGSPKFWMDPDKTQKYKISACDTAGVCADFGYSNSITTPSLPDPFNKGTIGGPGNLLAVGFDVGRIDLSMSTTIEMSPLFAAYGGLWIDRAPSASGEFPQFISLKDQYNVDGRYFYNDGSANKDTSYTYTLKFYESDDMCDTGRSAANGGPQATFSPVSTIIVPVAPNNLISAYDRVKIALSWNDRSDNEDYFSITRSTDAAFIANVVPLPNQLSNTTSFNDEDIQPNVMYYYRVRACTNSGGCSYYAEDSEYTAQSSVQNLRSFITYTSMADSPPSANILLVWDAFGASYTIKRDGAIIAQNINEASFEDGAVPLRKGLYVYEVSSGSDTTSIAVSLDMYRVLRGEAWAMATSTNGAPCTGNNCQGIGWVSFNSMDLSPAQNPSGIQYSVQIDQNGLMSGAAWASAESVKGETRGYGWLSFNKDDLSGCPGAPLCEARMDIATGKISGWARFTGAAENPTPEWDGWVNLGGQVVAAKGQNKFLAKTGNVLASLVNAALWKNFGSKLFTGNITDAVSEFLGRLKVIIARAQTGESYGIYYQPLSKRFSGAGWGGAIIGWVAFGKDVDGDGTEDCPYCSVRSVNRKPVATNVKIEEGNLEPARSGSIWCAAEPYYKIKFGYEDADNDPPYQADIEFHRKSDGALALTATNFSFDCSPLSYASPGTTCSTSITDPLGYVTTGLYEQYLDPNTEYYVKVRVADGLVGEGSEGWWTSWVGEPPSVSSTAKTPTHYYPFVSFAIDPDPPVKGAIATSTDTTPTTVAEGWLGGNDYTIAKREWKFEKANPSSVTNQTTVPVVFYALPSGVTLTLTDSEDNICAFTRNVGAGGAGTGEILKRRVFRER